MAAKILLVDDSNTVLLMERMLLNNQGYALVTAKNGREGVEKALSEKPDLILMDVMMPELNGFDACKEIRSHPETSDIPIIMVTTKSEATNVQIGFASGCTDYITKPINGSELIAKVKTRLRSAAVSA